MNDLLSLPLSKTPVYFLREVIKIVGNISSIKFSPLFGVSPLTSCVLWKTLSDNMDSLKCQPKHLLWMLAWLKNHWTESVAATFWECDEKTHREWVKKLLVFFTITCQR
jgi:hypothetical protein